MQMPPGIDWSLQLTQAPEGSGRNILRNMEIFWCIAMRAGVLGVEF